MEDLNGNIHYQIFCGIRICPESQLTNYKLIDNILLELSKKLKIQEQQKNHFNSGDSRESIPNRIVSVSKPSIRPIVRGKETKTVEFGAKCNNILIDGISFIEKLSFNAFNEGTRLKHCVSLAEKLTGVSVKKIGGDQGYSGNDNRTFCKENGIRAILVTTPVSSAYRALLDNRQLEKTYSVIEEMCSRHGAEYHDYMADSRFTEGDFHDSDHLSDEGAKKFTLILKEDLTKGIKEP